MKIDVYFLLRSRQVKKRKVSEAKKEIEFKRGIYLADPKAINYYSKGGKPKGVESFYFEGNPSPIQIDAKGKDTSIDYLNKYIYENVIEQTGALPKERAKNAFNWVRDNVTIASVFKWAMIALIVFALIRGMAAEYLGIG